MVVDATSWCRVCFLIYLDFFSFRIFVGKNGKVEEIEQMVERVHSKIAMMSTSSNTASRQSEDGSQTTPSKPWSRKGSDRSILKISKHETVQRKYGELSDSEDGHDDATLGDDSH